MSRMDQTLVTRIVEAALLAANQPLSVVQLHALFPLDEPAPDGNVATALQQLQQDCAGRGVELVELASGWRFQVQADVHPWVARLWTERQTKYTRATLETLALIAYRQPITRGEIEQVRGVAVSSTIIKALEEREWIRVVGHRDVPGRPELLATTRTFLDYFGLQRLDQLPPLSELRDFGELEPQLPFEPSIPAGIPGDGGADIGADEANAISAGFPEVESETSTDEALPIADQSGAGGDADPVSPGAISTTFAPPHPDGAGNDAASDTPDPQRDDAHPASSEHTA